MSQTILAGYYGFGNAGDELILRAILQGLGHTAGGVIVLSNDPDATERDHQVRAVNRWSFREIANLIRGCDAFVLGGGGLLQDSTGFWSISYYLGLLWIAQHFNIKNSLYAVGLGPIRNPINRFLVRMMLEKVDLIAVRDETSRKMLEDWGVTCPIRTVSDPVLGLRVAAEKKKGGPARLVFIVRRLLNGADNAKILQEAAYAIDEWTKRLEAEVRIGCLQPSLDEPAMQELEKLCAGNPKVSFFRWKDLDELIRFLADSDFVVSMRLHGAILAALLNIPMAGVEADPKIPIFLRSLDPDPGFKNVLKCEPCDGKEWAEAVIGCWEQREAFMHRLQVARSRLNPESGQLALREAFNPVK